MLTYQETVHDGAHKRKSTYFAIYLITPLELIYHLAGSLDRLLMHVWPACLLLAGMVTRSRTSVENS